MWDSNTPLQVINSMPKVLEDEHLEKLQKLLEADKYKNQLISGSDVCGTYAPFCEGCDKENKYPCAVAYVNYLKEQGEDIEIASEQVNEEVPEAENSEENVDEQVPESDEATADNVADPEPSPAEESVEVTEDKPAATEKTRIRIAIARKKIL